MKKRIAAFLIILLLITAVSCRKTPDSNSLHGDVSSIPDTSPYNTDIPSDLPSSEEPSTTGEDTMNEPVIQVSDGENVITFRLNNSIAAKELYDQLPLSLEVEDYSNNEKIFYPPNALDVSNTPKAGGGMGTLAYYAPWADVVMFFGSYSPNGSLYELGHVIYGSEQIQLLKGTITIETVP